ncbi:hypothetical protein ACGF3J_35380 [Streptomyces sp. NPDC048171]|uniref:hypothetical protein n=1 Tax=Streptomyces sp. NPDC048171 TaxID=3365504 RepID=UPI0037209C53
MDDLPTVRAQEYEETFNELLQAASRLDRLRRLEGGGVDAHGTAAMHAVEFTAAILWPVTHKARRRQTSGTTRHGRSS